MLLAPRTPVAASRADAQAALVLLALLLPVSARRAILRKFWLLAPVFVALSASLAPARRVRTDVEAFAVTSARSPAAQIDAGSDVAGAATCVASIQAAGDGLTGISTQLIEPPLGVRSSVHTARTRPYTAACRRAAHCTAGTSLYAGHCREEQPRCTGNARTSRCHVHPDDRPGERRTARREVGVSWHCRRRESASRVRLTQSR